MNKRYLLVIKNRFSIDTMSFYTSEEASAVAKNMLGITTIIDLENENIKWQGEE